MLEFFYWVKLCDSHYGNSNVLTIFHIGYLGN